MNAAVKYGYAHIPVTNRVGAGKLTYQFIIESDAMAERYEIFANSLEEALQYSVIITNMPVVSIAHQPSDTVEVFYTINKYRYYLYLF